jgi:hypothetical protein
MIRGTSAAGPLMASSLPRTWKVDGRELVLDEAEGLVMAAQRLDHLIRVVEHDHLRPQPW